MYIRLMEYFLRIVCGLYTFKFNEIFMKVMEGLRKYLKLLFDRNNLDVFIKIRRCSKCVITSLCCNLKE